VQGGSRGIGPVGGRVVRTKKGTTLRSGGVARGGGEGPGPMREEDGPFNQRRYLLRIASSGGGKLLR